LQKSKIPIHDPSKLKSVYMKKITFFIVYCTLLSTYLYAQPGIIKQKTIGGNLEDYLRSVNRTADGGIIAGGSSASPVSGDKTSASYGGYDYWIVKTNAAGNIQWDKTFGGSDNDELYSLQQTSDGGYILGGYSASGISGNKTDTTRGANDYWVVKTDAAGNMQWDKTIGGNSEDFLYDLQQTADGGYILSGASASGISGEKSDDAIVDNNFDYWVVKLDALGNVEWDKTIGGDDWDQPATIRQTADGGYITGGTSTSNISGNKTENSRGSYDYWIVKSDASGNVEWDKTIGGSAWDSFSDLQQTNEGNYIISGSSDSPISGDKTQSNKRIGFSDYWIVLLTSSGQPVWDKTIGGRNDDYNSSIIQTADGGFISGGSSYSNASADKSENSNGLNDYWLVKLNSNGKIQWEKTIGGAGTDALSLILEIRRNQYLLAGSSASGISGDKAEASKGGNDYWLVRLNFVNPANITSAEENNIAASKKTIVYPNPAKDILHIQNTSKATFVITGQSGKILITKTLTGNGEIAISHLPSGVYYLKNNETGEVQKVIISK
jgi:hypothetical protein